MTYPEKQVAKHRKQAKKWAIAARKLRYLLRREKESQVCARMALTHLRYMEAAVERASLSILLQLQAD